MAINMEDIVLARFADCSVHTRTPDARSTPPRGKERHESGPAPKYQPVTFHKMVDGTCRTTACLRRIFQPYVPVMFRFAHQHFRKHTQRPFWIYGSTRMQARFAFDSWLQAQVCKADRPSKLLDRLLLHQSKLSFKNADYLVDVPNTLREVTM